MTYTIRPLEWVKNNRLPEEGEWWSAETVFGNFEVEYDPDSSFGRYTYRYCFDECYDEGTVSCDSIDDAKAKAEAYYLGRLLPALEPAAF